MPRPRQSPRPARKTRGPSRDCSETSGTALHESAHPYKRTSIPVLSMSAIEVKSGHPRFLFQCLLLTQSGYWAPSRLSGSFGTKARNGFAASRKCAMPPWAVEFAPRSPSPRSSNPRRLPRRALRTGSRRESPEPTRRSRTSLQLQHSLDASYLLIPQ